MSNIFQPSNFTPDNSNDVLFSSQLDALYSSLNPQHVEQFYQGYSAWQMHRRIATLEANVARIDQQINDNVVLMQLVQPSAIALATLSRLQSYGVDDINLLDRMLERGDEWLDHAMQLLTRCEGMNLIHESYTEWCQHAIEGAYDWLDSMNETESTALSTSPQAPNVQNVMQTETIDTPDEAGEETAELLLRKLMNDEETVKAPAIAISQPLEQSHEQTHVDVQEGVQEVPQEEPVPEQTIPSEVVVTEPEVHEQIASSSEEPEELEKQEQPSDMQAMPDEHPADNSTQKLPGRGLVSRVLAKIWNVS